MVLGFGTFLGVLDLFEDCIVLYKFSILVQGFFCCENVFGHFWKFWSVVFFVVSAFIYKDLNFLVFLVCYRLFLVLVSFLES